MGAGRPKENSVEIKNSFSVRVPVHQTWEFLTDLKRVAPCMPGAQLTDVVGDDYHGSVAVRVGPFSMSYQGVARFLELDHEHYRAVVRAEGREAKGQGSATATIVMVLEPDGGCTVAQISSTIEITGKAAQFGRSMLADVSGRLLQQFAERLEADLLLSGGGAVAVGRQPLPVTGTSPTSPVGAPSPVGTASRPASALPAATESIDALGLAARITGERLPEILAVVGFGLAAAGMLRAIRPGGRMLAGSALAFAASTALRARPSDRAVR